MFPLVSIYGTETNQIEFLACRDPHRWGAFGELRRASIETILPQERRRMGGRRGEWRSCSLAQILQAPQADI